MKDRKKVVTIYDVASLAGVSAATVSRVLNEPEKVMAEKRQMVLDAISELNFVPKAHAVANARREYKKIAIVSPLFTPPAFMERLRGVSSVLASCHYEMILYTVASLDELENYVLTLTNSARVDGLIFFSLNVPQKIISMLEKSNIHVCFIENRVDNFDCVTIENLRGGRKAAELFYSKGCRKPAFIGHTVGDPMFLPVTEERFSGYRIFFEEKGVSIKKNHVIINRFSDDEINGSVEKLLDKNDMPDCVFCSDDIIAVTVLNAAHKRNIKVPQDLKILGFDDIDIAKYTGISSVSQNLDDSGRTAANLVLEKIRGTHRDSLCVSVNVRIVERETT